MHIQGFTQQSITQGQALNILKNQLDIDTNKDIEISVFEEKLPANTEIQLLGTSLNTPKYESWTFFIDDNPLANWGHPCRYAFVNIANGNIKIIKQNMPPTTTKIKPIIHKYSNETGVIDLQLLKTQSIAAKTRALNKNKANNDYAVIISGGGDPNNNHIRYWNDCATIYSILRNTYMYPKDHIYVIMADGTSTNEDRHLLNNQYDSSPLDLDGDGVDDIQYSACKENIEFVFRQLAQRMTCDDNLFIFTTDHGTLVGEDKKQAALILWDNSIITDKEFATALNWINANKINICMEQCYSGGFIDDLESNSRLISTACRNDELSYATENKMYNEFAFHWSAAVLGSYPSGKKANADTNNDGKISMSEAFNYAKKNDIENEHPQCSFLPKGIEHETFLRQDFCIKGPKTIYQTSTYTIDNLPQGYNVKWSLSCPEELPFPTLKLDPNIVNTCIIENKLFYPLSFNLTAQIINNGKVIGIITKKVKSLSKLNVKYQQEACYFYGKNHPKIPSHELRENIAIFVHQGCEVKLSSPNLGYFTVSHHDGIVPDELIQDDFGNIYFTLPLNSGGKPFNLYLTSEGKDYEFHFLFFTVSNNADLPELHILKSNISDGYLNITINHDNQHEINKDWDIEIYNIHTGERKVKSYINNSKAQIDIADWEKGTYIISATHGDKRIVEKLIVK